MLISKDHISIRDWNSTDLYELVKIADNPNIAKNMSDLFPSPFTVHDAKRYLNNKNHNRNCYAIDSENKLVGAIGLKLEDEDKTHIGNVTYWIGEPYWGKGIATKALKLFTKYSFEKYPVERLEGKVYTWNDASARVLEKAGYKFESLSKLSTQKNGERIDQLIYYILKEDFKKQEFNEAFQELENKYRNGC